LHRPQGGERGADDDVDAVVVGRFQAVPQLLDLLDGLEMLEGKDLPGIAALRDQQN
jgi:hypothetical protein